MLGWLSAASGARLAFEALEAIGIARQRAGRTLSATCASELGVRGEIDLAHPAFAQLALDSVMTELRSDHVCRDYSWGQILFLAPVS